VTWPEINAAAERAKSKKSRLAQAIERLATEDTSVVVFGSLARDEVTDKSDVDWTLLVDGQANPRHHDISLEIRDALADLEEKKPGREETFGGLAFSHDLLHRIGGGADTNRNLTQRILLLLESSAIGAGDAHQRVVREILKRYILEDFGWLTNSVRVPRFLLNDIARYWRTVAVDFAYKRRERRSEGWALRTVKLRLSRKLTYASGLLACFSCASALSEQLGQASREEMPDGAVTHPVVEHLSNLLRQTPLDIVAQMLLPHDSLADAALEFFGSYDQFLALLNDPTRRNHLDELAPDAAPSDSLFQDARDNGHRFQKALDGIFLEERTGVPFFELTKQYGVF
jgi:predicted nucleotidyltransferase